MGSTCLFSCSHSFYNKKPGFDGVNEPYSYLLFPLVNFIVVKIEVLNYFIILFFIMKCFFLQHLCFEFQSLIDIPHTNLPVIVIFWFCSFFFFGCILWFFFSFLRSFKIRLLLLDIFKRIPPLASCTILVRNQNLWLDVCLI